MTAMHLRCPDCDATGDDVYVEQDAVLAYEAVPDPTAPDGLRLTQTDTQTFKDGYRLCCAACGAQSEGADWTAGWLVAAP